MAILRDVGESLKKLLQQHIPELSDENSIIFDSPADIEPNINPRLSIFLYLVIENNYLKNVESEPIGIDHMRFPPLILDLYYIFTPYANNRETELIILESLIQTFYDYAVLKGDMINESLVESGNNELRLISNNLAFEEITKLWERFPDKDFKLSVSYILTPVRIPSGRPITKVKRVLEKDIDFYMMEDKNDFS
jgi:hypothetical protein